LARGSRFALAQAAFSAACYLQGAMVGITLPRDGASPVAVLSAAHARETCRRFLARAPSLGAGELALSKLVQRALLKHPNALLVCFSAPAVTAALNADPLRDDLPRLRDRIDRAMLGLGPHIALEMAARRLFPTGERLAWPRPIERMSSPALGITLTPAPGTTVSFLSGYVVAGDAERLALDGDLASTAALTVAETFQPLAGVTRLALVDENPLAEFETHPEKSGNVLDLGGRPVGEWRLSLTRALETLVDQLPGIELRPLLQQIVPVGWDAQRHLSASYREAIGTIYLTLHPSALTMAEAILHELQHNKANLASYRDPLLENAFSPLFPSPVRPDPRPLWGILLAAHAFLPVAELHRKLRASRHPLAEDPGFEQRADEVDGKNHEAIEMLRAHGKFTEIGRALFEELAALDRQHREERATRGLGDAPTSVHE
jgi:HEXXH motif-containing protein